jgi:hypothetical protein
MREQRKIGKVWHMCEERTMAHVRTTKVWKSVAHVSANNEKSWLRTGANNESLAHVQTTKNGLALWLIGLAHGQTIMQTTEKVVNRFGTWAINRLWHMCEQRKMGKIWFGACANKESWGIAHVPKVGFAHMPRFGVSTKKSVSFSMDILKS